MLGVAAGIVGAAVLGASLGHSLWPSSSGSEGRDAQAPVEHPAPGDDGQSSGGSFANPRGSASTAQVAAIAAKVSPALVDINTNLGFQGASAAGTGVVLSADGTVLTNNHVISGATKISATDIGNGRTYAATVVGYDRSHDIAVIKLTGASGLATASLGDSANAAVGQSVVGIGNAGGRGGAPSTATGTITALDQEITASDESNGASETLSGLIQTDAPIEPGDSGGALVDTKSRVIGINTAASSGFQFSDGNGGGGAEGYAIPINAALDIAHQITSGTASDNVHIGPTGFLGVRVQSAAPQPGSPSGVEVAGTVNGSPAEKLGLQAGDVITAVDGTGVRSPEQLTRLIGRHQPGQQVRLTWVDAAGSTQSGSATLMTGPAA